MSVRDEIREQPEVLRRLLAQGSGEAEALWDWVTAQRASHVVVAARGTSMHVGYYAKYLFATHLGLDVSTAAPSLFTKYHQPPRLDGALVVGISQSGQSPDVVEVLAEARRQGRPTLAIVNAPQSPLAESADRVFDVRAGTERMVAATKSYTAQLAAVALLAAAGSDDPVRCRGELERVPDLVARALELEPAVVDAAAQFAAAERCVVVGRGYDYATTHEWSLKLKELAYVVAERYSSADFRHGPIAVVARGFPVLAIACQGAVSQDLVELLERLRGELGAQLLVVGNEPAALRCAAAPLALPHETPEWLSPLVSIVPAQLFAYHSSRAKGFDPDAPRGLAKVTRTA